MILSILICSLEARQEALQSLIKELLYQRMDNEEIEILTEIDNRQITTGAKRNLLLNRAQGKYIIFIDDDDWVEPCYIAELLRACASDADCFAMNGWITTNGQHRIEWRLSKDYYNQTIREGSTQVYLRTVNHITGVKRHLALQAGFPDKSNAEDKWYSDRVAPLCKTEYQIVPLMYHYRFETGNKQYV